MLQDGDGLDPDCALEDVLEYEVKNFTIDDSIWQITLYVHICFRFTNGIFFPRIPKRED